MVSFSRRSAFGVKYVVTGSPRPTLSLCFRTPRERKCQSSHICHRSWGDLAHVSELRTGAGSRKLSFPHCCCREHRHNVGNVFLIEKGLSLKERRGKPCWADGQLLLLSFGQTVALLKPAHCLSLCGPRAKIGIYTRLSSWKKNQKKTISRCEKIT